MTAFAGVFTGGVGRFAVAKHGKFTVVSGGLAVKCGSLERSFPETEIMPLFAYLFLGSCISG
jgi:hypothetical protein